MNRLLKLVALLGLAGVAYPAASSPPAGNYIANVSTISAKPAINISSATVRDQLKLTYISTGSVLAINSLGVVVSTTITSTGGGGGSTNGSINAANQFSAGYYSLSGSSTAISGSSVRIYPSTMTVGSPTSTSLGNTSYMTLNSSGTSQNLTLNINGQPSGGVQNNIGGMTINALGPGGPPIDMLVLHSSYTSAQGGSAMLSLIQDNPLRNDPMIWLKRVNSDSSPEMRWDSPSPNMEMVMTSGLNNSIGEGKWEPFAIASGSRHMQCGSNRANDNSTFENLCELYPLYSATEQPGLYLHAQTLTNDSGIISSSDTAATNYSTLNAHTVGITGPLNPSASYSFGLPDTVGAAGQVWYNSGNRGGNFNVRQLKQASDLLYSPTTGVTVSTLTVTSSATFTNVTINGTCTGSGCGSGGGVLAGGATSYVQNTSILQSGATFYVSSGTVLNNFYVGNYTDGAGEIIRGGSTTSEQTLLEINNGSTSSGSKTSIKFSEGTAPIAKIQAFDSSSSIGTGLKVYGTSTGSSFGSTSMMTMTGRTPSGDASGSSIGINQETPTATLDILQGSEPSGFNYPALQVTRGNNAVAAARTVNVKDSSGNSIVSIWSSSMTIPSSGGMGVTYGVNAGSATIGNLTNGRIALSGLSGLLTDSANLQFSNTTMLLNDSANNGSGALNIGADVIGTDIIDIDRQAQSATYFKFRHNNDNPIDGTFGLENNAGNWTFRNKNNQAIVLMDNLTSQTTFSYGINIGSMTGSGLTTCGDSTHALGYTSTTGLFSCQNVTGSASLTSTNTWTAGQIFQNALNNTQPTVVITSTGTANALQVNAGGNFGTSDGSSGGALFSCADAATQGPCVQLYSNQGLQRNLTAPLYIVQKNTAADNPNIYVVAKGTSPQNGIRLDGSDYATLALIDTLRSGNSKNGKFQFSTHNNGLRAERRNSGNSAFESAWVVDSSTGTGIVAFSTDYTVPISTVDIKGNLAIGSSVAGVTSAPVDGLLVQGNIIAGSSVTVSGSAIFNKSVLMPSSTQNSSYAMTCQDNVIFASSTFTTISTMTLPSAACGSGMITSIYKVDRSTTPVMIIPASGQSILGSSQISLATYSMADEFISDGVSTWYPYGKLHHPNAYMGTNTDVASAAVLLSSTTYFQAYNLEEPCDVKNVNFSIGVNNGQFSAAIYDEFGKVVVSTGPLSMGGTGNRSIAVTRTFMRPGLYYLGFGFTGPVATVTRYASNLVGPGITSGMYSFTNGMDATTAIPIAALGYPPAFDNNSTRSPAVQWGCYNGAP